MAEEDVFDCSGCGGAVYQESIDSGIAKYEGSDLYCPHCLKDRESSGGGVFEPIEFNDVPERDVPAVDMTESRIQATAATGIGDAGTWDDTRFQRPVNPKGATASRCRTFHCKLTDAALSFMTNQINDWLDKNEDICVKFSTSCIGMFEGKHSELNLFLTLFY